MKKNKVTFKQKMSDKVQEGLKKAFKPLLDKVLKASYNVLIQEETKLKKEVLTSFEEFGKRVNEILEKGENE